LYLFNFFPSFARFEDLFLAVLVLDLMAFEDVFALEAVDSVISGNSSGTKQTQQALICSYAAITTNTTNVSSNSCTLHHLTTFFQDNRVSRHQKGKPFGILLEQEMIGLQWHQLDHMQIICISLHTDNHASTSTLSFYRPDGLPAAQPTASKH